MNISFTPESNFQTNLDYVFKFATVSIALFNVIFTIVLFRKKDKKENVDKEKERKIQLLKNLVLDYSLGYFYEFFEKIDEDLLLLKNDKIVEAEKKEINEKLGVNFVLVRRKFIDSLIAIDKVLYGDILHKLDELHDHFTNVIFDPGINLSHTPKFNELILEHLTIAKTDVLKTLFQYRG